MYTTTFLLALGLAAQQAVAGGSSWGQAKPFSCPGNTPTTCSNDQSSGFNWGSAQVGQQVTSYGGCGFSGVTCQAQGPGGKLQHKRGGAGASDKCVSGPIHGSKESCPKMSAGKGNGAGDSMSPSSYHVSCSYDTHVDFTYEMPDGSSCKHTSPCSAGGNDVQNTQCGGAKSVTCSQSDSEKKKNNGKECSMGIHSVGFQCGSATTIVPPPPKSTSPATKPQTETHPATKPETKPATTPETMPATTPETKPATTPETKPATTPETKPATTPETKPATTPETKPATTPATAPGTTQPPAQQTTPVASSKPFSVPGNSTVPQQQTTPVPVQTTVFQTTSVVYQTTEITVTSCAPEITNCPAESKTPMVITKTISQFTTVCPVTATMVPSSGSMVPVVSQPDSSAPAPGNTQPVATSKAAESSAPGSMPSSSPNTPSTPLNCPDVVPSCMNTLLQSIQTDCSNNADTDCLCSNEEHTKFIQECIAAHANDADIQNALSYVQGICAAHIPQNPSIVTHQPQGVPQQPACPSGLPATTITVQVTQPATSAPGAPAPTGIVTIQSTITVPQVQVTQPPTAPGETQPAPALIPGNGDSTAPAATQGPAPTQPANPVLPPTAVVPAPTDAMATQPAAASQPAGLPGYGAPLMSASAVASTGGIAKPSSPISPPIATGAAGKVGISFGAAAVAAALLF